MEYELYEEAIYQKERTLLTRKETGNYQILEKDINNNFRYSVICGKTGKIKLECKF